MATLKSIKNKYLDASDGTVLGVTTNTENIAALSFKLATEHSLRKFNLVDGFTDMYQDATGVDATSSTNENRNSDNYYSGSSDVTASGGDVVTTSGDDTVRKFTTVGAGTFITDAVQTVEYLVVAGGGGGSGHTGNDFGGGGGGGGVRAGTFTTAAISYTIAVGAGGAGKSGQSTPGGAGGASSLNGSNIPAINATGGGGGGWMNGAGTSGGSGGGGGGGTDSEYRSSAGAAGNTGGYSPVEGYAGGNGASADPGHSGGGGGGAGGVGGVGHGSNAGAGAGGPGIASDILVPTVDVYYGGGGGGSATGGGGAGGSGGGGRGKTNGGERAPGTDGLGGGGGGGAANRSNDASLSDGGSGVVIIRHPTSGIPTNMTLVSNTFTAQANPTTARIIIDETSAAGSTTLDTDLKAYASRDGGTTYTQTPLVNQGNLLMQNQGGIDSYTKLMINCDGANDGTTFTDTSESAIVHAITAAGNTHTDTAVKKFGTASGQLDGAGDYLSIPHSTDFNFDTANFTVDFWFRTTSLSDANQTLWSKSDADYTGIQCNLKSDGSINFAADNDASSSWVINETSAASLVSTDTWYHYALVRNGAAWIVFLDGTSVISTTATLDFDDTSASLRFGNWSFAHDDFIGYMDEIRVSKGVARWTANFTPPTAPYTTGVVVETTRHLVSGSVDISGQPAGSNVKYKIETLNQSATKETRIYGTSMAWA